MVPGGISQWRCWICASGVSGRSLGWQGRPGIDSNRQHETRLNPQGGQYFRARQGGGARTMGGGWEKQGERDVQEAQGRQCFQNERGWDAAKKPGLLASPRRSWLMLPWRWGGRQLLQGLSGRGEEEAAGSRQRFRSGGQRRAQAGEGLGRREDIFKCRDVCEHMQKSGEHYSKATCPVPSCINDQCTASLLSFLFRPTSFSPGIFCSKFQTLYFICKVSMWISKRYGFKRNHNTIIRAPRTRTVP